MMPYDKIRPLCTVNCSNDHVLTLSHSRPRSAYAQAKKMAVALAARIKKEKGVSNGVAAFYRHLPADFLEEKRRQQLVQHKLTSSVCLPPPVSTSYQCKASHHSPMHRSQWQGLHLLVVKQPSGITKASGWLQP